MESAATLKDLANGLQGLGHPVRIRALVLMDRSDWTPKQLADVLGNPLGVVAYHVRMLRDYGLIEEVRTEPVRGALAHYYHRTALADELMRKLNGTLELPKVEGGRVKRFERLAEWTQAVAS